MRSKTRNILTGGDGRPRVTPGRALAGRLALIASLLWMVHAGAARAQTGGTYDLRWSSIDGGGGRSDGGTLSLHGTIGQADAGQLAAGSLVLAGGFWKGGISLAPAGVEEEAPQGGPSLAAPLSFRLHPNTPNPFASSTALAFDLPEPAAVRLAVYAPDGSRVRGLALGTLPAGHHARTWDGRDEHGRPLPNGVYFLRIEAGEQRAQRKLWLIR